MTPSKPVGTPVSLGANQATDERGFGRMKDKYDVFVSHASEDKAVVVRPLVNLLKSCGVTVWLDEAILDVGDSLSATIDRGLIRSRYGLVVLSPEFLAKIWPEYELRSLLAREIGNEKVILPIWHGVSKSDVLQRSPWLADKFALDTGKASINEICLCVLKVVRPDIFKHVYRWLLYRKMVRDAEPQVCTLKQLKISPIRNAKVADALLLRMRLVWEVVGTACGQSFEEMRDNFLRDAYPGEELHVWERIAASFLVWARHKRLPRARTREIVTTLVHVSLHSREQLENMLRQGDGSEEFWSLVRIYAEIVPRLEVSQTQRAEHPSPNNRRSRTVVPRRHGPTSSSP